MDSDREGGSASRVQVVEIRPVSLSAATYIAANLRDQDRFELEAIFSDWVNLVELTGSIALRSDPFAYVAYMDGNPVFCYGVIVEPHADHLGVAWGFGTDKAWKTIPEVSRHVRDVLKPELIRYGIQRVEVRVIKSNKSSLTWLSKYMGGRQEVELPLMGRNGETFIQFAWTR